MRGSRAFFKEAELAEGRTKQVIDLSGSCDFTEQPDGSVRVRFAPLDLDVTGADQEDAFKNLVAALGEATDRDENARDAFNKWAQEHVVEVDMTDDEVREERMVEEAAVDAGHAFTELDTSTFDDAIATEGVLLVDFWAPWCRPCLMLAPVLKEIHEELAPRFDIAKLNVDESPELSDRFGIQGIPCMILFQRGEEVGRIVGMGPKYAINDEIVSLLEKAGR
jgi:thioredoxin 1